MVKLLLRSVDFHEGEYEAPSGAFRFKFEAHDINVAATFEILEFTKGDLAAAESSARQKVTELARKIAEPIEPAS